MSASVYPTLPGLTSAVTRTPTWKTGVMEAASGREYRVAYESSPRYVYKVSYEVLREQFGLTEMQTLAGFFNAMRGSFDTFLYTDQDDNTATLQVFGTGDGATLSFQLLRTRGGFAEPVFDLNSAPSIYVNGVLKTVTTDYTLNGVGLVTFVLAPPAAQPLTWSGTYYWRCRFKQDATDFAQFLRNLWEAKSVSFVTVKP